MDAFYGLMHIFCCLPDNLTRPTEKQVPKSNSARVSLKFFTLNFFFITALVEIRP